MQKNTCVGGFVWTRGLGLFNTGLLSQDRLRFFRFDPARCVLVISDGMDAGSVEREVDLASAVAVRESSETSTTKDENGKKNHVILDLASRTYEFWPATRAELEIAAGDSGEAASEIARAAQAVLRAISASFVPSPERPPTGRLSGSELGSGASDPSQTTPLGVHGGGLMPALPEVLLTASDWVSLLGPAIATHRLMATLEAEADNPHPIPQPGTLETCLSLLIEGGAAHDVRLAGQGDDDGSGTTIPTSHQPNASHSAGGAAMGTAATVGGDDGNGNGNGNDNSKSHGQSSPGRFRIAASQFHIATPLYLAARCGDAFLPLVESLLERGARANAGHANGEGALIAALSVGAWKCAGRLLEAGARLQRDAQGTPPAIVAIAGAVLRGEGEAGVVDMINDLMAAGAKLGDTDRHGRTVLHAAAKVGFVGLCETLAIDSDALINTCDDNGDNAGHIAAKAGQREVLEALAGLGLDLFCENNAGESVRQLASQRHLLDV